MADDNSLTHFALLWKGYFRSKPNCESVIVTGYAKDEEEFLMSVLATHEDLRLRLGKIYGATLNEPEGAITYSVKKQGFVRTDRSDEVDYYLEELLLEDVFEDIVLPLHGADVEQELRITEIVKR